MAGRYADVALRLAAPGTFQFSVPEELEGRVRLGQRVRVPLRQKSDIGYIVGLSDTPKVSTVRPLSTILDDEPCLPEDLLETILWVVEHHLASPGLVLRAALPRPVHFAGTSSATARDRTVTTYTLGIQRGELPLILPGLEKRAPVQAGILKAAAAAPDTVAELVSRSPSALKALIKKGLLQGSSQPVKRGLIESEGSVDPPPSLTPSQEEAFQRILPTLGSGNYSPFLIHGVTGSGKTEIYLRAIRALPSTRQALVLVPEVSLTVQLIELFRKRLGQPVAVWHHQLSEGEKHDLWKMIRRGEVQVVIGARSAVFAPLPDIGLLIVDEEQEASFKQDEAPGYHARETALTRARLCGATILLGSATPSIESYYEAQEGRYTLLTLPERYNRLPLPPVELLDIKDAPAPKGNYSFISENLRADAARTLQEGNQVLFFLNRRGYAPYTHCGACGWASKCPNCQVSLVLHRQNNALLCHYCGFSLPPPETCPSCGGATLRSSGAGTQRLESELRRLFPENSIARLDRDTVARKGASTRLVTDFAEGRTDILVGTQMAAKGLHFPRLTLVAVLSPDISLNLPDFRAAERTFQVVTQVSGRAGRGDHPGRVLIQSFQPEHYALKAAASHDYGFFYGQELEFRRELDYPPFVDLILLRADGPVIELLEKRLDSLAAALGRLLGEEISEGRCQILGPVPAPLLKIKNRYRYQILIKTRSIEAVTALLRSRLDDIATFARKNRIRMHFDFHPVSMM